MGAKAGKQLRQSLLFNVYLVFEGRESLRLNTAPALGSLNISETLGFLDQNTALSTFERAV